MVAAAMMRIREAMFEAHSRSIFDRALIGGGFAVERHTIHTRTPLVSIIITVFRRDTYLRESISSALAQNYGNVEVIVTEDGGSDCAKPIIDEFADPRLRYRRNAVNLGESG